MNNVWQGLKCVLLNPVGKMIHKLKWNKITQVNTHREKTSYVWSPVPCSPWPGPRLTSGVKGPSAKMLSSGLPLIAMDPSVWWACQCPWVLTANITTVTRYLQATHHYDACTMPWYSIPVGYQPVIGKPMASNISRHQLLIAQSIYMPQKFLTKQESWAEVGHFGQNQGLNASDLAIV